MQASRRNERIIIRRKVASRDSQTGAETVTWQDDPQIWASADPIGGREFTEMAQIESEINVRFTVEYEKGKTITTDSRVLWRGVSYDILNAIDVKARRRDIELTCRTTQNG